MQIFAIQTFNYNQKNNLNFRAYKQRTLTKVFQKTEVRNRAILKMFENGATVANIAKQFQLTAESIRQILKSFGIKSTLKE